MSRPSCQGTEASVCARHLERRARRPRQLAKSAFQLATSEIIRRGRLRAAKVRYHGLLAVGSIGWPSQVALSGRPR